jgi:ubiquinone/menaquinone biosynthesis C-methylase UbiE
MQLKPGARMRDVGCGLGGSAFVLARDYQAQVTAIDLSVNMIDVARERCSEYRLQALVEFVHGDCLELLAR